MADVRNTLNTFGIVDVAGLFDEDEVAHINLMLDDHFAGLTDRARSYAYSADLIRLGLVDRLLTRRVVDAMAELIDDPILYHFHVYEIASRQDRPHIAAESLAGWHRDPDSAYVPDAPSHLSLFVYLTDVAAEDGAFEFIPDHPTGTFHNNARAVKACGTRGHAFFWNRHFFHRAAPNRGKVRRRLLKFSFQARQYYSRNLETDYMSGLAEIMRHDSDERRRRLFGADASDQAEPARAADRRAPLSYRRPAADLRIRLDAITLAKSRLKGAYRTIRPRKYIHEVVVGYD